MTNDTFPTHIDLMWPTCEALKQLAGSGTNQEIFDKIIEIENYPAKIQGVIFRNNITKLQYRAAWARSYLKVAGVITNSSKGVWSFTKEGETISPNEVLKKIKEGRKNYIRPPKGMPSHKHKQGTKLKDTTSLENAKEESTEVNPMDWKQDLLEAVKGIKPDAFERLCQRVLLGSGFSEVKVTGKVGDGGIDGVCVLRIGLLSFQVFFQCKRYQGSVSASAVRDFRGSMDGRSAKGILITTGSFTRGARIEATRDGATPMDLIDGEELCDRLKKLKLGVQTHTIEQVKIDSDWFKGI